jgi:hypothetical protein
VPVTYSLLIIYNSLGEIYSKNAGIIYSPAFFLIKLPAAKIKNVSIN